MSTTTTASGFTYELRRVRDLTGMTETTLGRGLSAGRSTVRAWLAGTRTPNPAHADRIAELASIVDRLIRVVDGDYIVVWLLKPLPVLDDRAPIEALAEGNHREVSQLVSAIESPVAA